ncbi:sigma-70 family RNA polymerase sigma factor [Sunxiuqinia sp. A32]|uniref:sigma-70 family RNA polymerase sigma factor n=1 Tax=Sunxiuqinia sp. A32 TaxID=3461496 RepID=UPI0040460A03
MDCNYYFETIPVCEKQKRNHTEFFEDIYRKYRANIDCLIRSRIQKICDVEDLVQDVFTKVWEYREEIDESRPIQSLLFRMTTNLVYSYKKHENVARKHCVYIAQRQRFQFDSPYSVFYYNDIDSTIEANLKRLPRRQRDVFNLFWKKGLSRQEIAKEKDLSVRTVDNQLYRVRKILREELDKYWADE